MNSKALLPTLAQINLPLEIAQHIYIYIINTQLSDHWCLCPQYSPGLHKNRKFKTTFRRVSFGLRLIYIEGITAWSLNLQCARMPLL